MLEGTTTQNTYNGTLDPSPYLHQKGRRLYQSMFENNLHRITTGEPTYWPTDRRKKPDVIDFCIVKGISVYQFKAESSFDLTSDYLPILITLNATITKKDKSLILNNAKTDWNLFRDNLNNEIICKIQLKIREEIDGNFTTIVQKAAWESTSEERNPENKIQCSNIKTKITEKRKHHKENGKNQNHHPIKQSLIKRPNN